MHFYDIDVSKVGGVLPAPRVTAEDLLRKESRASEEVENSVIERSNTGPTFYPQPSDGSLASAVLGTNIMY